MLPLGQATASENGAADSLEAMTQPGSAGPVANAAATVRVGHAKNSSWLTVAISITKAATALTVRMAPASRRKTTIDASFRFICKPETGQRHTREADTEFLQRRAARDRLGHALGEFIELVVHKAENWLKAISPPRTRPDGDG